MRAHSKPDFSKRRSVRAAVAQKASTLAKMILQMTAALGVTSTARRGIVNDLATADRR